MFAPSDPSPSEAGHEQAGEETQSAPGPPGRSVAHSGGPAQDHPPPWEMTDTRTPPPQAQV
jgi:hypothetical protein